MYLISLLIYSIVDQPPSSIQAVKDNLTLIQQLLRAFNASQQKNREKQEANSDNNTSPSSPIHSNMMLMVDPVLQKDLLELISELKNEIYSGLEDFVQQAQIVLSDHFNLEEDVGFDMVTIDALVKLTSDQMDENVSLIKNNNNIIIIILLYIIESTYIPSLLRIFIDPFISLLLI